MRRPRRITRIGATRLRASTTLSPTVAITVAAIRVAVDPSHALLAQVGAGAEPTQVAEAGRLHAQAAVAAEVALPTVAAAEAVSQAAEVALPTVVVAEGAASQAAEVEAVVHPTAAVEVVVAAMPAAVETQAAVVHTTKQPRTRDLGTRNKNRGAPSSACSAG